MHFIEQDEHIVAREASMHWPHPSVNAIALPCVSINARRSEIARSMPREASGLCPSILSNTIHSSEKMLRGRRESSCPTGSPYR
jgi:hypothetical protein